MTPTIPFFSKFRLIIFNTTAYFRTYFWPVFSLFFFLTTIDENLRFLVFLTLKEKLLNHFQKNIFFFKLRFRKDLLCIYSNTLNTHTTTKSFEYPGNTNFTLLTKFMNCVHFTTLCSFFNTMCINCRA